jgi:hypothetical protein
MKKLLLFVVLFISINIVSAQNCTPTWPVGGGAGIDPDSATNLPWAYEVSGYSADINFKVPKDTTAVFGGFPIPITIQNITIDSVKGLNLIPSTVGFGYASNPSTGIFQGDSVACINITGTPAPGSHGDYPLTVYVTANAVINLTGTPVAQPYTVPYYQIHVNFPLSNEDLASNEFAFLNSSPNPALINSELKYYLPHANTIDLKVYSSLGQLMIDKKLNSQAGVNYYNLDLSRLDAGNYFITMSSNGERRTARMTVVK